MSENEARDRDDRDETKSENEAPTDVRWGALDAERWGDPMNDDEPPEAA